MHQLFFNILLIALPTQLGYHFWPAWAMVLGRKVDFLSPILYFTDILILLTLIFWRPKKVPRTFFLIPVFALVNIIFAANRFVSVYFWLKALEYALLGFYIVQTKQKFSSIVFFLSIGVLYSSVIAIVQFVLQRSVGGPLWFLGERTFSADTPGIARADFYSLFRLRPYATFPHPNVLGGFLAIMLPIIMSQIKNKKQPFHIAAMFLGTIALVVTFSRSAWIIAIIGVALVSLKKKYFIPLLVFGIALAMLITGTLGAKDESVLVRKELNNSAIAMFVESPIVGKGLGNYLVELPKKLVSRQIYFLQPDHNIYLLAMAETGILGLVAIVWTLVKALKGTFAVFKLPLVLLLLVGLVDHYPVTLQQGQLMLTIFLSLSLLPPPRKVQ